MLSTRIASRKNELGAQGLVVGQSVRENRVVNDRREGGITGGMEREEEEKKYESKQWHRHIRNKD